MKGKKLNFNQQAMLRRRGLNPDNYVLLKNTHAALCLLDLRYNKVKILYKWN